MFDGPVLVVAAHPDDETLGCGATIARLHREGVEVRVVVCGDTRAGREDCVRAAGILGVVLPVLFLGWPDQRFDTVPVVELAEALAVLVEDLEPATVLTHSRADLNLDHRVVHEAVLVATRPLPGSKVGTVGCWETPSSTEWGVGVFSPSVFVEVSVDDLRRKQAAMWTYQSEHRQAPHPRSSDKLRALAYWRGGQAGCESAEAFEIVRSVV